MGTMFEPHFLSTHSSNPLQVPSDDAVNQQFVEHIRPLLEIEKARAAQGLSPRTSTPSLLKDAQDDEDVEEDQLDITIQPLDYHQIQPGGHADSVELSDHGAPPEQTPDDAEDDDGVEVRISQYGSINVSEVDELDDEDGDEDLLEEDVTLAVEHQLLLERFHDENTILLREPEDRALVQDEIDNLERAVPRILGEYLVMDRLGEGTFSSVYKAIDLSRVQEQQLSTRKPQLLGLTSSDCVVALKRIYVTSSPARIANELSILADLRECRHVSQLITAFRFRDQVVAVMPYIPNQDFREVFMTMSLPSIQGYFRCLFSALCDIHALGIVHRDVKPANFLFNPFENTGILCDFGLAQRLDQEAPSNSCLHTVATLEDLHGRHRLLKEYERTRIGERVADARKKSTLPSERVGVPAEETRPTLKANRAGTRGFRAPEVLLKCQDQSVALDIWSAGTIMLCILACKFPIFSASDDVEALMELAAIFGARTMEKCAKLHCRTFSTNVPSVNHDGLTWGDFVVRINPYVYQMTSPSRPTSASASSNHSRIPSTNKTEVTSTKRPIKSLPQRSSSIVAPSNSRHPPTSLPPSSQLSATHSSSSQPDPNLSESPKRLDSPHNRLVDQALDLLGQCLHWDATRRITAQAALEHPFLTGGDLFEAR